MSIFYFICGTYKKSGNWYQPKFYIDNLKQISSKLSLKNLVISPIDIIIDNTKLSGAIITDGVSSEKIFAYNSTQFTQYGQDLMNFHKALCESNHFEYFCRIQLVQGEVNSPIIKSKECKTISFDDIVSSKNCMRLGDYRIHGVKYKT